MTRETSPKRRFAGLLGTALIAGTIGYAAATTPGVDWPLVIAISLAGLLASALALLTIWLVGRPLVGLWWDRRTSS